MNSMGSIEDLEGHYLRTKNRGRRNVMAIHTADLRRVSMAAVRRHSAAARFLRPLR